MHLSITPSPIKGGAKMVAVINREKCDGCETCVEACPSEAITIGEDKKAKVDAEECVDCEACVDECPNEAISMSE
jgi:NAD-dependent dihydropyrimidine dehydrogenase PreA subunit